MNHWILKTEPETYSFERLQKEGKTFWDGVRNFQARNNMNAMKKGDQAFIYHSGESREVVGIAEISEEAKPDPTAESGSWVGVTIIPVRAVKKPVPLAAVKAEPSLANIHLVRNGRLSVSPLTKTEYETILKMSE